MTAVKPTHEPQRPIFDRLVAFEVYDGPVSGVVFTKGTDEPFYFTLQAWDEKHVRRVFSLSKVDRPTVERAIAALSALAQPRWPEWWLQRAEAAGQQGQIERLVESVAAAATEVDSVMLTRDILRSSEQFVIIRGDKRREEFLALSRRTHSEQEVTDSPYDAWLRIFENN